MIDLARVSPWLEAVVLADSALRQKLVTKQQLHRVVAACHGWPGVLQAARVVDFADARMEAVSESLARVVFAQLGLPMPEPQVEIFDATGFVARVDFLFKAQKTVIEIDGQVKYTDRKVLWAEKRREDLLRQAGYEVVRLTWADLMHHPAKVKSLILAAFARAAARR